MKGLIDSMPKDVDDEIVNAAHAVEQGVKTDAEGYMNSEVSAKVSEGNGSRVRVELNGERAVFHRPHPENTTDKGAIKSVRRFLENARVRL
ncbi:MAG: type II toxin-antitoxin system HicA family toxin [Lachnospiraceae bacterium]|nr:type II toxin-antitoxin system HicA family toxin [Lachnospiraceae bacterium]